MVKIKRKTKSDEKVLPKVVSEKELLDIAMGVSDPSTAGLKSNKYWNDSSENRKDFIRFRREVRRGIYAILKSMKHEKDFKANPKLNELFDIINDQLDPNIGMRWSDFTDKWDIHPKFGLQVIIREHWVREGGGFDAELGSHYPFAFTKQVI